MWILGHSSELGHQITSPQERNETRPRRRSRRLLPMDSRDWGVSKRRYPSVQHMHMYLHPLSLCLDTYNIRRAGTWYIGAGWPLPVCYECSSYTAPYVKSFQRRSTEMCVDRLLSSVRRWSADRPARAARRDRIDSETWRESSWSEALVPVNLNCVDFFVTTLLMLKFS